MHLQNNNLRSGSKMYVFPSQSQNPKKDPLPFALKVAYMRKMFPKYAKTFIANKKVRMVFELQLNFITKVIGLLLWLLVLIELQSLRVY